MKGSVSHLLPGEETVNKIPTQLTRLTQLTIKTSFNNSKAIQFSVLMT